MTKLAFFMLTLTTVCWALLSGTTIAADDKIDITGVWNCEIEIAGMQGMPVFTFKQDGEKLTGKYKGTFGEADLKGTVKGHDIEFSFDAQGVTITYTGTIDKDTMKGKANYADQATGEWKAKKKAP